MTHGDSPDFRFIQTLGSLAWPKNTVIAFVSDHGDMMGDHGLCEKAILTRPPRTFPLSCTVGIAPGARVDSVVEIRDVMPTLLGDLPAWRFLRKLRSLRPSLDCRGRWWVPWKCLHGEHLRSIDSVDSFGAYKYVWFGWVIEQLFRIDEDPEEWSIWLRLADARSSRSQRYASSWKKLSDPWNLKDAKKDVLVVPGRRINEDPNIPIRFLKRGTMESGTSSSRREPSREGSVG